MITASKMISNKNNLSYIIRTALTNGIETRRLPARAVDEEEGP
jgi:hypothetical protein